MHLHRSFFSTCNLQLHRNRDAGIHSFLWILRIFEEHFYYGKAPANWFWKENFMKIGKPTFYNKDISWSWQLFPKTDIARESVCFENNWQKIDIVNVTVVFNSSTDIAFRKYVTEIFCDSYYFQEKNWECFEFSVGVFILSSKRTN